MRQQSHKCLSGITKDRLLDQLGREEESLIRAVEEVRRAQAELERRELRAARLRRAMDELKAYDAEPAVLGQDGD
jgi:hypothetical protein